MDAHEMALLGVASLIMSILSGIAGSGGSFVMTPLAIFLGFTPAQAVATGKITGLAVTIGSLSGMRKAHGRISKKRVLPVMGLALIVGLIAPHIIASLDNRIYRVSLGIILLFMIPVMVIKKVGLKPHHPSALQKYIGGGLLTFSLFLQGIFSGGVGTLVNIVLMGMLGMTAIEANVTKRYSQLILNITIVLGLLGSELIIWHVAAVLVITAFTGSYIGGKMAINKGDEFIMRIMICLVAISAVALIVGA